MSYLLVQLLSFFLLYMAVPLLPLFRLACSLLTPAQTACSGSCHQAAPRPTAQVFLLLLLYSQVRGLDLVCVCCLRSADSLSLTLLQGHEKEGKIFSVMGPKASYYRRIYATCLRSLKFSGHLFWRRMCMFVEKWVSAQSNLLYCFVPASTLKPYCTLLVNGVKLLSEEEWTAFESIPIIS